MKKTTYILIASLGLNVALLLDEYCFINIIDNKCEIVSNENLDCACNDRGRYSDPEKKGGGDEISMDQGREWIANFQRKYGTRYKGAFLSKHALDQIFCSDTKATGIVCYMGLKDDNEDTFNIIIQGLQTDESLIEKGSSPSGIFASTTFCPEMCSIIGE